MKTLEGRSCLRAGARIWASWLICSSLWGSFSGMKEFCKTFFSRKRDSFFRKFSKKTFKPLSPIEFQTKWRYIRIVVFWWWCHPLCFCCNIFFFFFFSFFLQKKNQKKLPHKHTTTPTTHNQKNQHPKTETTKQKTNPQPPKKTFK